MPTSSNWQGAFDLSIWHWQQIKNKMAGGSYAGCGVGFDNGRNETLLVARSQIAGANGYAHTILSGCTIVEGDVLIANDMNPLPDDESFWGWTNNDQGQVVLTHELGHVLGLNHFEDFDVMRAFTPLPITGGSWAQPFGDDANGVRFLYGGSSTNLFVSAQKLLSNTIVATTSTQPGNPTQSCQTFTGPGFCRGQVITVNATFGNNGTTSHNNAIARVYLNNSPNFGTGWNLWVGTVAVNAGGYFTFPFQVTIPTSVPNGFYWILWDVDGNNAIAEFNESDDTVHSCMTVNITC